MTKIAHALFFIILATSNVFGADSDVQVRKEQDLANSLKGLVTCKNMGVYEEGDLYCSLNFRGLHLQFAGVNQKTGGTIYVTSLGPNQTLSARGSRCIEIAFGDDDLRGIIPAHILFRNDGVITHTSSNQKSWGSCQ